LTGPALNLDFEGRKTVQANKTSLPPLDYLLTFEVAAKHESFSGASREIGISESAISRKVRLLEQHYKTPLFRRGSKSISLTAQGALLLKKIQPSLKNLRDVSAAMFEQENSQQINLAATNSVTTLWLIPRLRNFKTVHSNTNIAVIASDEDSECLAENVDFAILRGDGQWPDHTSQKLFGETIFPVCSPEFLANNPTAADLETLSTLSLIEVSSKHPEWMNWNDWLTGHISGFPALSKRSVFNAYPHAIQAAVDGLGIALGWSYLIDPLLESGELVRPIGDIQTRTEYGYYLLQRAKMPMDLKRQIVKDWLLTESAAST
jgi:LysR family glycine cleavage system transcriptional activator